MLIDSCKNANAATLIVTEVIFSVKVKTFLTRLKFGSVHLINFNKILNHIDSMRNFEIELYSELLILLIS